VQALRERGHQVVPVPGPSAIITALSAAGLPTDRFLFEGFLPHKAGGRRDRLEPLINETATMVFYESKHRILETMSLMADAFGRDRKACVARELTKTFETFYHGTLADIQVALQVDNDQTKGEFVVMVAGNPDPTTASAFDTEKLFRLLLVELPPKKAAAVVAELTGENKKSLYQRALEMQGKV
jgi:16S rRNA (cytidine1402-2'-O)-methyltransferase